MHATRILELFERGELTGETRVRVQSDAEARPLARYIRELVWMAHRVSSGRVGAETSETQTLFDASFMNAPVGMVVSDLAGRITNANDSFAKMLGYRPRELVGLRVGRLSASSREREVELGNELMGGVRDSFQVEKDFLHRDGRKVSTLTVIAVARDSSGAPLNVVAHVLDLTELRELRVLNQAIAEDRDTLDLLNAELERRVKERTHEVQTSEERFVRLFERAPQATLIANRSGHITRLNVCAKQLFSAWTSNDEASTLKDLMPGLSAAWEQLEQNGDFQRSEGKETRLGPAVDSRHPRWGVVTVVPVTLHGEGHALVGIQEVTEAKRAQEQLAQSLREKNTLLREIHHRVKNNLQVVSSLLVMQSEQLEDEANRVVFRESVARVRAIALVHEFLYRVDTLAHVNMRQYGSRLADTLRALYNPRADVDFQGEDVALPIETAVPLALIMNEALTNAFKYGVSEVPKDQTHANSIRFRLGAADGDFYLEIRDYGKGIALDKMDTNCDSLGMQIIRSLCRQLRAEASWSNDGGAVFSLRMALPAADSQG